MQQDITNATEYKWLGKLGILFDLIFPKILQITFQYENMPMFIKASAVVLIDEKPNGFLVEIGMDPNEFSLSLTFTNYNLGLKF